MLYVRDFSDYKNRTENLDVRTPMAVIAAYVYFFFPSDAAKKNDFSTASVARTNEIDIGEPFRKTFVRNEVVQMNRSIEK